ncbi:stage II sporulation protein M [Paenibacillus aceris]|uniref:Membrane protein SpoIIM required for sporulation n=1 Tax=Paenibacillus aceris TaxID=869555 RepID=A0ABS4I7I1_9BACL|nr:stage II sporulation protein M [Paenibacillus aceris]MBP1966895.1 putative membrane protein SpoIIM required for sporulation [Paenibacillus aceris]NHW38967.1 stage II sporulation protein M [Paenibacillus aceris]
MDISRFIREHKSQWTELEQLLIQLSKRKRGLHASHINRFTELYKTVSAHLATMQTHSPADETTVYLNHLVSQAHNAMYRESHSSSTQMKEFFLHYFPSLIRARSLFVALAFLLFVLGGLLGFLSVWKDPLNLSLIMPGAMADSIDPSKTADPRGDLHSPLVSTAIMTNNIRVAVLAFISGVTLGIGTVYLMISNGLLVGALAAVFMQSGKGYVFWAYILPHGIIELTAIFIAGGAGLYMGYRFFVPGPYPRKLRFLESAKESAQLLIGTIPLFIIAGIIEGYITPSTLSLEMKYIIAGITLLLLALYYIYGIRKKANGQQPLAL